MQGIGAHAKIYMKHSPARAYKHPFMYAEATYTYVPLKFAWSLVLSSNQ